MGQQHDANYILRINKFNDVIFDLKEEPIYFTVITNRKQPFPKKT
jgi:hypothetical protein